MLFFRYATFVQQLSVFLLVPLDFWICMIIGGVCFLAVYVFQAIGLYTIARREGYDKRWMAFVPFFNTYYIGVCGQKNKCFNIDSKKFAVATAVVEFLLFAAYVLYFVAYFCVATYVEVLNTQTMEDLGITMEEYGLPDGFSSAHPSLAWAGWCYNNLDIFQVILNLVYVFLLVLLLNCFFQTYSARHYVAFSIFSALFPVQGILIFIVRNNKAMSYAEYIHRLQEQTYNIYRSQQNYYRDPYNNSDDGYRRQGQNNRDDDPFSEYGAKPPESDDPFDEFKN